MGAHKHHHEDNHGAHKHHHEHNHGAHKYHHEHNHGAHKHHHEDNYEEHKHQHEHCDCGHDHDEYHAHSHEEHHSHSHTGHEFDHISQDVEQRVYILENLGCANCAAKMERQIRELPGVETAIITFATKQLRVAANHQEDLLPKFREICQSIESEVNVVPREERITAKREKTNLYRENQKEFLTIGVGAALFITGILLENIIGRTWWGSSLIFIVTYILLGRTIIAKAAGNLVKGHVFDENFLMSIATLAAFVIGDYPEAVGVMLFYRIGELFEHIAVERSRSQIMEAVDMRPEVVHIVHDEHVHEIPAGEAQVGELLLIRPGDRIPLDGIVVEGESRIDTSPMTGEPVPVAVRPGSELMSGCVNEQGVLKIKVTKPLSESMVSRILDSVENAAASKPKLDRFITRFARVYTPIVVAIALATAILPSLFTGEWNKWIYTAITFLVISCPCALVLSVPLAFFSGIGAGSKQGILFKGGAALEALKDIKAVVMDKTGTITKGEFSVQRIQPCQGISEEELLRLAAQCEMHSTHPIAHSIVRKADETGLELHRPENVQEIKGKGILAVIDGEKVLCGNRELLKKHQVKMSSDNSPQYGTEVYVAKAGRYLGQILIADSIKDDAKDAVKKMKEQKLKTVMLTGDSKQGAKETAEQTGIEEVYAKLLPEDKLERIKDIREKYGAVLFVGDGINDAPVLAGADVGAAMGSGADAAIEAADVVFMNSSVTAITEAVRIAKKTGNIAMQNVVGALVIKALVMVLGFAGYANMWLAVFADTGVAMLCVLNSIRILYQENKNR